MFLLASIDSGVQHLTAGNTARTKGNMNQPQPCVFVRDKVFVLIRSSLICAENRRSLEFQQQPQPPPNPELSQHYNIVTKEPYIAALAVFPHCCLKVKTTAKSQRLTCCTEQLTHCSRHLGHVQARGTLLKNGKVFPLHLQNTCMFT